MSENKTPDVVQYSTRNKPIRYIAVVFAVAPNLSVSVVSTEIHTSESSGEAAKRIAEEKIATRTGELKLVHFAGGIVGEGSISFHAFALNGALSAPSGEEYEWLYLFEAARMAINGSQIFISASE